MVAITNTQTDFSDVIACTRNNFTAECQGNAFMVTINAPQLDLLYSWCQQTGQITERIIISLQSTKALLDTVQLLVNFANVLGQAIQLRAAHGVDVTLHALSDFRRMLQ